MLDHDLLAWIRARLPALPARVLEVGAGSGELAEALRANGYDVRAIDPQADSPAVEPVALDQLDVAAGHFDAAIAVVSLHHVAPLGAALETLAGAVRPGGTLLIDELDVEAFDERAAAWLIERRADHGHEMVRDPVELVEELRGHIHTVAAIRAELTRVGFELEPATPGAYLYRWDHDHLIGHEADERRRIEAGELPAVGVRFAGIRARKK
jgi:SAM-dependent methyltransferase